MARFADDFDARRQVDPATDRPFNALKLAGLNTDEVRHSAILAWLLDSQEDHGQGTLFMRAFIEACRLPIPTEFLTKYRVRAELVGNEARTDVVIYRRGAFVIFIENKIYASEGVDQTGREYRDLVRLADALQVKSEFRFAVFLTPEGRPPTGRGASYWTPISHQTVALAFQLLLPEIIPPRVRYLLIDWTEILTTLRGDDDAGDAE
jgi:hypothetical protein